MFTTIGKYYTKKIQPISKLIQLICIPLIASIIPIIFHNKQSYCAYVMILMSAFWLLETLPMAITSLFPILLFPLFGIMTSRETSSIYFQDILMLFLAVIVITNSIKTSGLNDKLSLKLILLFGSNPKCLLFGIMFITWFLSIWISNNASVCMMMFPITVEIAKYLIKINKSFETNLLKDQNVVHFELENSVGKIEFAGCQEPSTECLVPDEKIIESQEYSKENLNILKAFCLSVTFSSTIGGSGSLIASPPNILLKGFLDEKYPNNGINFLTYILYSMPFTLCMLISAWAILCILFIRSNGTTHSEKLLKNEALKSAIKSKYEKLDSLNWEQKSVGIFFLMLIFLWLTRDVYWIKGWGYFFEKNYVTDTTPAMLILIMLTMWPKENIFKGKQYNQLIDWKFINQSFPWNILLFAGGSFALSKGFEKSNLSNSIGSLLQNLMPVQKELALGLIVGLSEIGTEFTCNFSMSSILLPIVNSLAQKNNIDPLYLLIHTIMSINFSFMLPIATPSNSIVFASGHVRTRDMLISGGLLKIVGICVIFLFSSTWYSLIFDQILVINNIKQIANSTFVTMSNKTI